VPVVADALPPCPPAPPDPEDPLLDAVALDASSPVDDEALLVVVATVTSPQPSAAQTSTPDPIHALFIGGAYRKRGAESEDPRALVVEELVQIR
jgi:hypothetical protein